MFEDVEDVYVRSIYHWLFDRYGCGLVLSNSLRLLHGIVKYDFVDVIALDHSVIVDLGACSAIGHRHINRFVGLYFNSPSFFDDLAAVCDKYIYLKELD